VPPNFSRGMMAQTSAFIGSGGICLTSSREPWSRRPLFRTPIFSWRARWT
jgi:hypothetical protein